MTDQLFDGFRLRALTYLSESEVEVGSGRGKIWPSRIGGKLFFHAGVPDSATPRAENWQLWGNEQL
ncbi:hypothetical protein [Bordetella genomosp. 9]|uniref:hypothetical protein n=1 Tax=Bordetella genomosp. 9 TaxID=1416803 RepID=UPI001177DCD1|nr:hypothetical protein [Bordetella genomosp. 9]